MADRSQGILLDTSTIIAHFRGRIDLFQLVAPQEPLFISIVVLGELYKGALKSTNPAKHQAKISHLLQVVSVLQSDAATAECYAATAVALESKGRPIPQNDIWIAAVAIEMDMPLATLDAHFDQVDQLTVLRW
jgi:tRNA(fMet)-specific endonuclease VapC